MARVPRDLERQVRGMRQSRDATRAAAQELVVVASAVLGSNRDEGRSYVEVEELPDGSHAATLVDPRGNAVAIEFASGVEPLAVAFRSIGGTPS